MTCKIKYAFILGTVRFILALKLQVEGNMDFGPKWNYEYRIKPLETDDEALRTYTAKGNPNVQNVYPKYVDIIVKNKNNSKLIQVAQARIFDRENDRATSTDKDNKTNIERQGGTVNQSFDVTSFKFSDEHTESPYNSDMKTSQLLTGKNVRHLVRMADDTESLESIGIEELVESTEEDSDSRDTVRVTEMMPKRKKKHGRQRLQYHQNPPKKLKRVEMEDLIVRQNVFSSLATKANNINQKKIPDTAPDYSFTQSNVPDIFIKPKRVKDDPTIKEFTRHIYEQSMKALEDIKDKLTNYDLKNEVDRMMRSYEDKFAEFVKDTQNQKIKTRAGSQKVILNTLDTSNRILDRLVNYMILHMDRKGILRSGGTESILINDINRQKELENQHLCTKMNICRTRDSFSKFTEDILNIILSASDKHVIEVRDACTEALKNTDFSNILKHDTQKRFRRGISDLERYNIDTLRPIFVITKNILTSKNNPIEVIGFEDGRVNKTLALLDILNNWDSKLPATEHNVLEWNDMRNSFEEWAAGKRTDVQDLVQHFTEHVTKAIGRDDAMTFDRNLNIFLGF